LNCSKCGRAGVRYFGEALFVKHNTGEAGDLARRYRLAVARGLLPAGEPCARCGHVLAAAGWRALSPQATPGKYSQG
jgi:hypothetical protein